MSPPPPSEVRGPGPAEDAGGPSGVTGRTKEPSPWAEVAPALDAAEEAARTRRLHLRAAFDELVAASTNANVDDEHDPEGATIAFERSQLDAHLRRVQADLAEIGAARERLAEGRYGRCERCGRPIPAARLEARPTARTCVSCASR